MSEPTLQSIRANQHNVVSAIDDPIYLEWLIRCYEHQEKIFDGSQDWRKKSAADYRMKADEAKRRLVEIMLLED